MSSAAGVANRQASASRPTLTRAIVRIAALVVLGASLSGCDLLTLLGGSPPIDPGLPFPSPAWTWSAGTATLKVDGETLVLDRLVGTAAFDPEYGGGVTWTDGEGLFLSYYGLTVSIPFGSEGYLSIDRVRDSQHWVVFNPDRCIVTTRQMTKAGLSGSAICRGLKWSDYFGTTAFAGMPEAIPGEPAFDADVTFEAH